MDSLANLAKSWALAERSGLQEPAGGLWKVTCIPARITANLNVHTPGTVPHKPPLRTLTALVDRCEDACCTEGHRPGAWQDLRSHSARLNCRTREVSRGASDKLGQNLARRQQKI